MSLVIIQTPLLTAEQKKRIGDRVVESLHGEGVPATSVVVLFQQDKSDVYLDGGLVHQVAISEAPAPRMPLEPSYPVASPPSVASGRMGKLEKKDLKQRMATLLEAHGAMSSFEAQEGLGLRDVDGAPAALRRVFAELEAEGLITKQGQRRGTRYVWKGQVVQSTLGNLPKLVKRVPLEEDGSVIAGDDPE